MTKKSIETNDAIDDDAFNKYLHAIGESIIQFNKQMEEEVL